MRKINISILLIALCSANLVIADNKQDSNKQVQMQHNEDGTFEGKAHTEHIDSKGTKVIEETKEKRVITGDGVEDTVNVEKVADPKGLMNKTVETQETTTKLDKNGLANQQIEAESMDKAGTKHKTSVTASQSRTKDGTIETEIKEKVSSDPKGLMNKKTTETNTIVREHPNGKTSVENKTE